MKNASRPARRRARRSAAVATITALVTAAAACVPPDEPPVEPPVVVPVLLVTGGDQYDLYYEEVLRAEGLNAFRTSSIESVTPQLLGSHRSVLLAADDVTPGQATMLSEWVSGGGDLIAMRPDPDLTEVMGLEDTGSDLSDGYLVIDAGSTVADGLTTTPMQFKGTADLHGPSPGTEVLATLHADRTTATAHPAVTRRQVGSNGGSASAFAYDLARTVVLLRQGNPAWVDQNRDGEAGPHRSNDLFFGDAAGDPQPDWVDPANVAIPQADEQQRLLANLVIDSVRDAMPVPRLWYLPRGERAAIVLTGDEHNGGDIGSRLAAEVAASPAGCEVAAWECVRSTVYLYPDHPDALTAAEAQDFAAQGFELALHANTGCASVDSTTYGAALEAQLAALADRLQGVPAPTTNRNHCIMWSGWSTVPEQESAHGLRLDTNYYHWPASWVDDTPGLFTGSGFPMRFADTDGAVVDTYQAATQMTDESGQTHPATAIALMDRALGAEGYFGTFVTNFHTDNPSSGVADAAVVAAAQARDVPLISAAQLLEWVDGRNGSTFEQMRWNETTGRLTYTLDAAPGAEGMEAMLPTSAGGGTLASLRVGTEPQAWRTETIKGIEYAVFAAADGAYEATYAPDTTPPQISAVDIDAAPTSATVTWTTDESSTSVVRHGATADLGHEVTTPGMATEHTVTISGLAPGQEHHMVVRSTDASGNVARSPADGTLSFTTPTSVAVDTTSTDFAAGARVGTHVTGDGSVMLAPAAAAEFDGDALPAGWVARTTPWTPGGTASVSGGALQVDGTAVKASESATGTVSVEFVATFGSEPFQAAGLLADVGDDDFQGPWAVVGTGSGSGQVRARTSNGLELALGSDLIGSEHRYRITRTAAAVEWWVDGALVHTESTTAPGNEALGTAPLRAAVSAFNSSGAVLSVDYIRMAPHQTAGSFTSRVIDAGSPAVWGRVRWDDTTPPAAAVTLEARAGNTPTPDGSWTAFAPASRGADLALTGRYLQYRATLTSADAMVSSSLDEVRVAFSTTPDLTPPALLDRTPLPDGLDVPVGSPVSVTFNEAMDPLTLTVDTFRLRARESMSDVPATVHYDAGSRTATLSPAVTLSPSTSYDVVVDGTVADLAGNLLGADETWAFTTSSAVPAQFADTSVADFAAGTATGVSVTDALGGELELSAALREDFSAASVPSGWSDSPWTGGASTISDGSAHVDGARLATDGSFGPGRALEFVATFGAAPFQHVGFAESLATTAESWAVVGTAGSSSALYARTNVGGVLEDVPIPGALGQAHLFRIEWTPSAVVYSVDGTVVHTASTSIPVPLRVLISDYQSGGPAAQVDWLRLGPHAADGQFVSRVADAGTAATWSSVAWDATTPFGTSLAVEVRAGNTAVPDGSWSEWSSPLLNPGAVSATGRYVQYRVTFVSAAADSSPQLRSVTVT